MRGAVVVVLWCALLVLGVDAQEPVAMRCYQGVSYSRVATGPMNPTVLVPKAGVATKAHYSKDELESPTVPEVVCNDTKDEIYIGCYSVCQQMHLQNMTAGTLDVPDFFIDVCRYGCATEVMINAMKRWNGGALQFDFMCGCRWDRSGTFWTDENVDYKGPKFCCPNCHWKTSDSPGRCPDEFKLDLKTCTPAQAIEKKTLPSEEKYANGMLCNLNTAARALLPLALIAASVIVSVTASSLTAASVTS